VRSANGGAVDEVHVFIAPRLVGGSGAPSPVGGAGIESLAQALRLAEPVVKLLGDAAGMPPDIYVQGRVAAT
jgi:diaminohydroxyphosphoribosylaminopyrimidine deaminase/5-amino-6-(5-phosphoribosylamino)uracil reductase